MTLPKVLSRGATGRFMASSLLYCLFLAIPFILFVSLKSFPHSSSSATDGESFPYSEAGSATALEGESESAPESVPGTETASTHATKPARTAGATKSPEISSAEWFGNANSRAFRTIARLGLFSAAASFGALGAAVSLISRARNEKDPLEGITVSEMLSIQTIGAVFASLLALMFMGGLIRGSLFPDSSFETWFVVIYIHGEFAKLLVWSFVAGFSERFVPQILENLVRRSKEPKDSDATEKG